MRRKNNNKKNLPKPSKELQKVLDRFPKILKRNEDAAKERARIRKNFEKAREQIFGKTSK